jgi:hypothetical protein
MAENKNKGETAAWEVVSVTESMHLATDPVDEAKDNEPPSDAMFMSGHFSLSQKTDLESLLIGSDSKSVVQNKSCHQTMDSSALSDKTKDELDVDSIEPTLYASSEYVPSHGEEVTRNVEDNSVYNEDKGIEERKDAGCKAEKAIKESEGGEESWWLKKLGLICQKVSNDKMLCVFVATAALVSVAILSRRWQREKLQFSLSKERMNFTVAGPLNRIKVLLTNNQHYPLTNTESSAFSQ